MNNISTESAASGGKEAATAATNEYRYACDCNPILIGSVLIASIHLFELIKYGAKENIDVIIKTGPAAKQNACQDIIYFGEAENNSDLTRNPNKVESGY